ncbi:MAG: radical SAM protein, partial [Bacteroidales bacterium]
MAESEAIAAALLALGWTRATDAADCDVAILNTCTVTGEADAKNRKALRTLLRAGKAAIIVTGCAVNIDTARYADVDPRISCEHDKERIPALAVRLARDTAAVSTALSDQTTMERSDSGFRTRVDLKIQDGCDNACSYCIVHVARGPARSVPAATVISRARTLADAGTRELVLVGIDLAAYRDADIDLARLVT